MRGKTGMSENIEQGHYLPTSSPKLGKGKFDAVGTFIDEGAMMTTAPSGISVNMKSGKLQNGENGF
jgi:hypothetical protein